jgi:hypothetical protein
MSQTYTYSISTDFPNGAVAPDVLTDEINDSSISTGVLEGMTLRTPDSDTCYIQFDVALSAGDKTTLDGIVAAHQGIPYLQIQQEEPGWNLRVEDRNLTVPPGSPAVDEYWIVAAGATGAWAGHDEEIAGWNGTTWQFQRPSFGLAAWIFDEDIVIVYVDDTSKWQPYGDGGGGGGAFGTDVVMAQSTAVSVTTSTSLQTKLTAITPTLAGGNYRLEVSYGWNCDTSSDDFVAEVHQDGVLIGARQQSEPTDALGVSWENTGTDQRYYVTRVFHLALSAQSYEFKVLWATSSPGDEASIWDVYMTLWRMT